MTLPLVDLHAQHASIRKELDGAIARVLEHAQFVQGPEVAEFEAAFAAYCGVGDCIGVANGTSAIELVLRGAGIGPGDEVITTPMTFVATAEAILLAGAKPVLADVDEDTALLSHEAVEDAITSRTVAVLPVHLYGQTVDLDAFRSLADRHKLFLLEDAAQAHGASWLGRRAGSVGDAASFSFFPGKNLGAIGDAGAVTTDDQALAARLRRIRDHGRMAKYRHDEVGTNARLDTLQAAVLSVKLPHLDRWNADRRRHAAFYDRAFAEVDGVYPIRVREHADAVYHQYVVRVRDREAAIAELARHDVATGVHYPIPLHRQPALEPFFEGEEFPVADGLSHHVLSLPVFPELGDHARRHVVDALSAFAAARVPVAGAVGKS